jgi:hypothetical protein
MNDRTTDTHVRLARATLAALASAAVIGCAPSYYPAIIDSSTPAPVPFLCKRVEWSVAGDVSGSGGFNPGEFNRLYRIQAARSEGEGWWRASGQAFAYGGAYDVEKSFDTTARGVRGYYGVGVAGDINVALRDEGFAAGVGVYAGLAVEDGAYRSAWNRWDDPMVPLASPYVFLADELSDEVQIAIQAAVGFPGLISINAQVVADRIVVWGGVAPFHRIGLGVGYRFTP